MKTIPWDSKTQRTKVVVTKLLRKYHVIIAAAKQFTQ